MSHGLIKKRVTVIFLVRADGRKYPPLLVFAGSNKGGILREVSKLSDENI